MKTKLTIALFFLVGAFVWSGEDIQTTVTIGEFSTTLPASWESVQEPDDKEVLAKRYIESGQRKVPIGELLGSRLKGAADTEAGEMELSAKQNPRVVRLLDVGKFEIQGGAVGRKVLIALSAQDPDYESPLIFYSIYLPQADGSSVTFKLRCGMSHFESLRKEFESIVANVKKSEVSDTP
ncbi:MAG: hypothetical protein PF795_05300 [Kiritimatiellae bacterium]|jgi:hypothetical protein|nr:hypothetical protein [Kiritimatiellia bacterium]